MTAPLAEQVAAALGEHALRDTDPACVCGWDWDWREVIMPSEVDFDPSRYRLPGDVRPVQHHAHAADAVLRVVAEWVDNERDAVLDLAAHEIEASVMPDHPNAGYRDGHAHAAQVVRSLTATGGPTRPPGATQTPAGVSQDPQDVRGAERGGER